MKTNRILPPPFEHMEKTECMGCEACADICPKKIIECNPDPEGYLIPCVEKDECIHCNLCKKVCPVLPPFMKGSFEPQYFGAKSKDIENIMKSSSGGIFSEVVKKLRDNCKGIKIAGAVYSDDFKSVLHILTDESQALEKMRGSKYIQSRKGTIYCKVKEELEAGGTVLFTGTPCEVGALKSYLCKDYEKLITLDFICKGSASPRILKEYVEYLQNKKLAHVVGLNMRYKWKGLDEWIPQFIRVDFSNHEKIIKEFYNTELGHAFKIQQRPCCNTCRYREEGYQSDITIGDFHGVKKDALCYEKLGTSVVIINSEKGGGLFEQIREHIIAEPTTKEAVFGNNRNTRHPKRYEFGDRLKTETMVSAINNVISVKDKCKMLFPVGLIRMSTKLWRRIKRGLTKKSKC